MILSNKNPWQREGVSILPKDFENLVPIVGQKKLFQRLSRFKDELLDPESQNLAGFFTVIGGWGVGKSRVGHEICMEGLREDVQWIVDGQPQRILEASLKQGVLPIFTRYVQITKGPFGDHLEYDNWIPCVIVETLSRLTGLREKSTKNRYVKNQDHILEIARKVLKPKGWDSKVSDLKKALQNSNPHKAARNALDILRELDINHLWVVVDEIEDITDVERDGFSSDDREGIDQALLTIIPRVIKAEEDRQLYPEANFLLLCSMAVGDLLKRIRAIDRRTGWHELTTNTYDDVEAFFKYFSDYRKDIAEAVSAYPKGLKEAAFFAANRNFGWFNVIMHHAHQNHRDGRVRTPELLKMFAEESTKGHGKSVFNLDTISDYRIKKDDDYDEVVRLMFNLFPQSVGEGGAISEEKDRRFLAKIDHGGSRRNLFVRVKEIDPPQKHRILSHMINCGFKSTVGTELQIPGETQFDLQTVLKSLMAYSICLPQDRREHLLVCKNENDFTDQIKGLTPYPEHADKFAPYLHGLLTDSAYQVSDPEGKPRIHIGPSFSFLLEFNSLNQQRKSEEGFLRDSALNTRLEEAFKDVIADQKRRSNCLLQGIANAWEIESAPVEVSSVESIKIHAIEIESKHEPLNFGGERKATFLYATGASEMDLEQGLVKLAKNPAAPVILILEEQEQLIEDLRKRIDRNVPNIAPFVVIHNLARPMAEHLIRLGLMGKTFGPDDLRTSHFHAVAGVAREYLDRTLKEWLNDHIENQGLLLRPMFFGGKVSDEDLQIFAKGYAGMLEGKSYHDVSQPTSGVLSDDRERDLFKRMVDRHTDPAPKHRNDPCMQLFINDNGDIQAQVPRTLLSMINFCGPVARTTKDLERAYLFQIPENIKAKDVVRHLSGFLAHLGFIVQSGDKLERVSIHKLETWVKRAKDWVEGEFETSANIIKAIHHEAGEKLLNVQAKDAKDRLKRADKKLESLSLDFIDKAWVEMNRESADGMPVYEQRLRTSLMFIRKVTRDTRWVYDPEKLSAFRYNDSCLEDFDKTGSSSEFPLWKRLSILKGFYHELDKKRKQSIIKIDKILKEIEGRVPDLDTGEKAFPIQPLTLPLSLLRQELDFGADKPEKTIAGAGTTLGVKTIGFKLAADQYREAFERLESIGHELEQPGKLVSKFMELLNQWDDLRKEVDELSKVLKTLVTFFSDAPVEIRDQYEVDDIKQEFDDLHQIIQQGRIREGTDNRETAGTPVFQLIDGLADDMKKTSDLPRKIRERIEATEQGILPSIAENFQKIHAAKLKAFASIRKVLGKTPPTVPDNKESTWGKTMALFANLIIQAEKEGEAFFADVGDTNFEDYIGFCEIELSGKHIDWHAQENSSHREALIEKKLLTLKLI